MPFSFDKKGCPLVQGNQSTGYFCPRTPEDIHKKKSEIVFCDRTNPNQATCAAIISGQINVRNGFGGARPSRGIVELGEASGVSSAKRRSDLR